MLQDRNDNKDNISISQQNVKMNDILERANDFVYMSGKDDHITIKDLADMIVWCVVEYIVEKKHDFIFKVTTVECMCSMSDCISMSLQERIDARSASNGEISEAESYYRHRSNGIMLSATLIECSLYIERVHGFRIILDDNQISASKETVANIESMLDGGKLSKIQSDLIVKFDKDMRLKHPELL